MITGHLSMVRALLTHYSLKHFNVVGDKKYNKFPLKSQANYNSIFAPFGHIVTCQNKFRFKEKDAF